jgi:hypothetical protein
LPDQLRSRKPLRQSNQLILGISGARHVAFVSQMGKPAEVLSASAPFIAISL